MIIVPLQVESFSVCDMDHFERDYEGHAVSLTLFGRRLEIHFSRRVKR